MMGGWDYASRQPMDLAAKRIVQHLSSVAYCKKGRRNTKHKTKKKTTRGKCS